MEEVMVKAFFKLLLATVLYTVLFILANALLPFSQGFKELGASADPMGLVFILVSSAWTCFTIYFIIRHTNYSGIKLFINILCIMFFVQYFMTQIETLFFGGAFTALTKPDIILIMLAGMFPLLGTVPLLARLFRNQRSRNNQHGVYERNKISIGDIAIKLAVIGILYLCIYMVFGYFVAWQSEELRVFYTGSNETVSFWGKMVDNIKTTPVIFPFQILRGILFGAAIIPLLNMVGKSKAIFVISVCLIYLCTAIVLIIPNALFPDAVRIALLLEMGSSMLVFGIIAGTVLWGKG
jgi:hypothetical protein